MEERKGFVFYESYFKILNALPAEESKEFMKNICLYALYGTALLKQAAPGDNFAAVGGAPSGEVLAVIRDFLVMGRAGGVPNCIRWSGIDRPDDWPAPGTNAAQYIQSDQQIFPEGGRVMAMVGAVGGIDGLVFLERGIQRMTSIRFTGRRIRGRNYRVEAFGDPRRIADYTYHELLERDFGAFKGPAFAGERIVKLETFLAHFGCRGLKLALELGLAVDVSHLSDPGFWDVEKLAKGPFIASHSNSRAIHGHPRNLTDDMFRAIRDHGGSVGINLYALFLGEEKVTVETVLRHVDHFLDMGGEKTLAIGGDLDGCDRLPEGISGIQDVHLVRDALRDRGYEEALLDDIFYQNLMRVLPMQD